MDLDPIYLAGIERSGTSLMFALLASHPRIAMTRRTNLWTYFYRQYGDLAQEDNLDRCLAMMARYKRLRPLQIDFQRLKADFIAREPSYPRLFALLEGQVAQRLGKPRWGDKSLNTERYADAIFAAYPRARIIHMIRDPRDRYASARSRWKKMTGKAGAGTAMWLASVDLARHNQRNYPDRYMILRYESVVEQPEETLRGVCAFMGEEYAPQMLTMEGAPRLLDKGGNSSYGKRDRGVIAADSVSKYRKVLSRAEIAFIQAHCRSEMGEYDYSLDTVVFSIPERISYCILDWPANLLRMAGWTLKERVQNMTGRKLPARRLIPQPETVQAG